MIIKLFLQVQIRALLNDTVGTLASGRYNDPDVTMGIILGTGTNGAYVEETKKITKLKSKNLANENMIINTEWGGYMSPLLPMTADDYATDEAGSNPGVCYFEKLISGLYMGEAVCSTLSSTLYEQYWVEISIYGCICHFFLALLLSIVQEFFPNKDDPSYCYELTVCSNWLIMSNSCSDSHAKSPL